MSRQHVDVITALIPPPETDVAALFRDDETFAAAAQALEDVIDPELEAIPAWRGEGTTYRGVEGFREMWLDWLEPWVTYHVHVDEIVELEDGVLVLVRDRARRHDSDAEVELISGSAWTMSDGRITRVRFYGNRKEALAAVGLPVTRGS